MILLEKMEVMGWEAAIRGMRNPMNSWEKSDSGFGCRLKKGRDNVNWEHHKDGEVTFCKNCTWCDYLCDPTDASDDHREFIIGPNDHDLMMRLAKAGSVDGKFRRMIVVYVDITAPLYWWKEFDTYKVGTVANSCSTMHKIHAKVFTLDDFSHEHLTEQSLDILLQTIQHLNMHRSAYLTTNTEPSRNGTVLSPEACAKLKKDIWWQLIQLLPSTYNQKRTVMLNYEVLANIYQHRRNHKLDEWRELCRWIESLPYSEIITCNVEEKADV